MQNAFLLTAECISPYCIWSLKDFAHHIPNQTEIATEEFCPKSLLQKKNEIDFIESHFQILHHLKIVQNVIAKALKFEVSGTRGRQKPKQMWEKQVENEMKKNGLGKEDACDQTKWLGMVKTMTIRNLANSADEDNSESNM